MAQDRAVSGRFGVSDIDSLFDEIGLPRPARTSNVLLKLEGKYFSRTAGKGAVWRLTPLGTKHSGELLSDLDVAALIAETARSGGTFLAHTVHTLVPPALAPPELLLPLRDFFARHPFDRNVLGMTRFPDKKDYTGDPLGPSIQAAQDICAMHGLEFHLASEGAIHDDLWPNVAGYMWASKYGIAFFEDRAGEGLNYNLTIEVGGLQTIGRRTALLKDVSIEKMPTDLVGKIYKSVDFDVPQTVNVALHQWIRDDLHLEACPACPKKSS
jgi:hypothetical protein